MVLGRRNDVLLVGIVVVALCVEVLILLHQMRVILLPGFFGVSQRDGVVIGEVLGKKKELRNQSLRSLTWYPLVQGDKIHLDDSLMTGAEASARLQVDGEGELRLDSNTLIRFSRVPSLGRSELLALEVNQGVVRVRSDKQQLRLKVREREFQLPEKSEVIVSTRPLASKTLLEVKKGSLEVQPTEEKQKKDVSFSPGEAIEVGISREINRVDLPLDFSVNFPKPEAVILMEADQHRIVFMWEGEKATRVELAQNAEFDTPKEIPVAKNRAESKLSAGRYFWRIKEGRRLSSVSQFTLKPKVNLQLLTPNEGARFKEGTAVLLKWKPVGVASGYTVQISKQKDFSKILTEKRVGVNELRLPKLKRGSFYWRVRAEHPVYGNWPFSSGQQFQMKRRLAPPKPTGVKIIPKQSKREKDSIVNALASVAKVLQDFLVTPAWAGEDTVRLQFDWKEVEGAKQYRFEISTFKDFREVLKSAEVKDTHTAMDLIVDRYYYWRVTGLDESGDMGQPSKPQRVYPKRMLEIIEERRKEEAKKKEQAERAAALKEAQKPISYDPKPNTPQWGVGIGGAYYLQNITDETGTTQHRGFPLNRIVLHVQSGMENLPIEFRLWYHQQKYTIKNPELAGIQSDLNHTNIGGEFFWSTKPLFSTMSLKAGVHVENWANFVRESSTVLGIRRSIYTAFLFGPTARFQLSKNLSLASELLIEGAPMGQVRGVGLVCRSRLRHRKVLLRAAGMLLYPEVELGLMPSYRWVDPNSRKVFTFDFSLALLFGIAIAG